MTPDFWQRLLAAELPAQRAQALVKELRGSNLDPVAFLLTKAGLSPSERNRVQSARVDQLEKYWKAGVRVLTPDQYPRTLLEVPKAPPALFVWGETDCLDRPKIAIVGTRSASVYGKAAAQKFAEAFALAGVTVVSGGASGIDGAAHKGAIEAGGKTAAVLGTGIDGVFPAEHATLFDEIKKSGCLMSQFAVGTPGIDYRFPQRNQVVASLSDAVLVVEAPYGSGALITAVDAADLGRPVFVVPGSIDRHNFRGSHGLIRDGAILVDHPDQILNEIGIDPKAQKAATAVPSSPVQIAIIQHLTVEPILPEKLVALTGLEPAEVLSELTMMELDGYVIRDRGGYAIRP